MITPAHFITLSPVNSYLPDMPKENSLVAKGFRFFANKQEDLSLILNEAFVEMNRGNWVNTIRGFIFLLLIIPLETEEYFLDWWVNYGQQLFFL